MEEQNAIKKEQPRYKSLMKLNLMVFNIALSSFYFGYCMVYLGTIKIQTINAIYNSNIRPELSSGLLNGCIPIGGLLGALMSSVIITKLSRRHCLLAVNCFALCLGALIFIKYYYLLILVRVGQGICVGFYSVLANLIVKELSPVQISGTTGAFMSVMISFGFFFGAFFRFILSIIFADPTSESTWWIVFAFPLLTITIQTIILVFVFPYETPKYLLLKEKHEEVLKLLKVIYKAEYVESVLEELKKDKEYALEKNNLIKVSEVQESLISEEDQQKENFSGKGKNNFITTFVAIHLSLCQQFAGVNAISVYGRDIVSKAYPELTEFLPFSINFIKFVFIVLSSYLLSRLGRKFIMQTGSLLCATATTMISIGFYLNEPESPTGRVLIIIGLFFFISMFGVSLGPIVWLYIPEIVQPKIVPYSTATNWIGASLIMTLFPILAGALPNKNPAPLFLFFAVWTLGSYIFNRNHLVETKDKSQRQINREFQMIKLC